MLPEAPGSYRRSGRRCAAPAAVPRFHRSSREILRQPRAHFDRFLTSESGSWRSRGHSCWPTSGIRFSSLADSELHHRGRHGAGARHRREHGHLLRGRCRVLLKPVPFPEPDRLVMFMNTSPQGTGAQARRRPGFAKWRKETSVIRTPRAVRTGVAEPHDRRQARAAPFRSGRRGLLPAVRLLP